MPTISRSTQLFAWAGLFVAALLIVVLGRQNLTLRARLERVVTRATKPRVGLRVPAVRTAGPDGRTMMLGEPAAGRRQLLAIFTTTCPYCRASQSAWAQIDSARAADPLIGTAEIVGVAIDSADSLSAYVTNAGWRFPVVRMSTKDQSFYRTATVPALMVIGADGRVLYYRSGVLVEGAGLDSVLLALRDTTTILRRDAAPDQAPGR